MDRIERTLAECKRRGLTVERTGKGWHIHGRGVCVRVANLEHVDLADLMPPRPGPRPAWREAR